jgi:hypothetical protein
MVFPIKWGSDSFYSNLLFSREFCDEFVNDLDQCSFPGRGLLLTRSQAMEIENTKFGAININGKTYEHDVIIRLSGEVVKRKKKLSKKYYGTSHVLSKEEAKFVFEKGCEQLIVGSGQMGNVRLSPEAEAYFAKKAIVAITASKLLLDAIFHVARRRSLCLTRWLPLRAASYVIAARQYHCKFG